MILFFYSIDLCKCRIFQISYSPPYKCFPQCFPSIFHFKSWLQSPSDRIIDNSGLLWEIISYRGIHLKEASLCIIKILFQISSLSPFITCFWTLASGVTLPTNFFGRVSVFQVFITCNQIKNIHMVNS